jgi:transcriptional regulator with XRE-family HTH domain
MRALTDPAAKRLFEEELLVGEAMENIGGLLRSLHIPQRDLAERLGVSESRVSQIVNGDQNLTLRTLAGVGWALGVRFELTPKTLSRSERDGTPAESDPPAPQWLRRMRAAPSIEILPHMEMPYRDRMLPIRRELVEIPAEQRAAVA